MCITMLNARNCGAANMNGLIAYKKKQEAYIHKQIVGVWVGFLRNRFFNILPYNPTNS